MDAKKRVLVVDDEAGIRNVVRIKLKLSGFDVTTVDRGAEAINIVRACEPDVVLLDMLMPGMNGLETLVQIRTFSQVPVIFFTARAESIEAALEKGANDFIAKPFQPDALVAKVKSILSRANGRSVTPPIA